MTAITPALMPQSRPRVDLAEFLLDTVRARGGRWTTGRVKALYRQAYPKHVYRSTIRRHLRQLRDAGHLEQHVDEAGRQYYLYAPKGGAS